MSDAGYKNLFFSQACASIRKNFAASSFEKTAWLNENGNKRPPISFVPEIAIDPSTATTQEVSAQVDKTSNLEV